MPRPGGETATTAASNAAAHCGLQVQLLPGPLKQTAGEDACVTTAGRMPALRNMPGEIPAPAIAAADLKTVC